MDSTWRMHRELYRHSGQGNGIAQPRSPIYSFLTPYNRLFTARHIPVGVMMLLRYVGALDLLYDFNKNGEMGLTPVLPGS